MYSSIIDRLKKAAICSNGLFVVGQLFHNQKERNGFFMLKQRHPEFFQEIFKGSKSSIYAVNGLFANTYEINTWIQDSLQLQKEEILKNLAWLPFCLTHNIEAKIPDLKINLDAEYFIDDFRETILKAPGVKIITLPFRTSTILRSKNTPVVAGCRYKVWVSRTLESFVFGRPIISIKGGFFPLSGDQCHKDLRQYPGVEEKISGSQKLELDNVFINNSCSLPANYQIGVYR